MSDDKDKIPPEQGEERTVFMPGGGATLPVPGAAPAEPPTEPATSGQTPLTPSRDAAAIKVGDMLNHIFEVKRFLARGGMGEVFEGCNVHTDEKVAIKVMLPALASDEKVIAMFRKEARTLTKLHHEALVEYRVLAQEPQLHVLYIVTDFIEGTNLGASLGILKPTPDELAELLKRLASGLASAHRLGAVHRDMSPDNVILEKDDIHSPKIIDFGIAKDLDASSATIVGDGFAGKLNYVAPEQLGDFGREIGPWTDVYSLGLVILAVAMGRNVDMSGSLVDAIDKRRRGPDVSAVPEPMQPLLEAMLRPDPRERLRSMDDVLAMLDGARIPSPRTIREEVDAEAAGDGLSTPKAGGGSNKLLIILAVLAGFAALVAAGWYATGGDFGLGGPATDDESGSAVVKAAPPLVNRSPAESARATIDAVLPSVPCSWLDIGAIAEGSPPRVTMRGVAGNKSAAETEIGRALASAGLADVRPEFRDVATIAAGGCAALDAFRQFRRQRGAGEAGALAVTRTRFEMVTQVDGRYAGRAAANAVVDLDAADRSLDFTLLGIAPSGAITQLLADRGQFNEALAQSVGGRPVSDLGDGRYRLHIDLDHQGWSGLLLISGRGPFPPAMVAPEIGARGPDWRDRFVEAAGNLGWQTDMVWFESVNRQPDDK
jgi:hypothetical protein